MANILFIDDDKKIGNYTKDQLQLQHEVTWICEPTWELAAAKIKGIQNKTWDLLLLDLHYPSDPLGGISLYNDLVDAGLRNRWNKTIVYSQHFSLKGEVAKANDGHLLPIRKFLEAANIPFDCALPNTDFDRSSVLEKVHQLLSEGQT